jgi:hypothetical protein
VATQDAPSPAYNDDRLGEQLLEAFVALRSSRKRRGLLSLKMLIEDPVVKLHAPGATFAAWKRRTSAATRVFNITMRALQEAQLQLQGLEIMGDVLCCSLPCDELAKIADLERLAACLRPTTSLALNISHHRNRHIEDDDGTSTYTSDDDPEESIEKGRDQKTAIASFLKLMPNLTKVDLRWYTLRQHDKTASDHEVATWNDAIPEILPASLQDITLCGFQVSSDTLTRLLSSPTIEKVSLRKVSLHTGEWSSVLDVLMGAQSNVRYVYLEDLFGDDADLVYFSVEGTPNFPVTDGNIGPNRMEWSKGGEPVGYLFAQGRALGSGMHRNWMLGQAQQVGPPDLIP